MTRSPRREPPSQTATGAVPRARASYWDIGVRGDTGPSNHGSGDHRSHPTYSVLTDATDYPGAASTTSGSNPTVVSQYCNGSRVPPELGSMGYQVPPGISDATVPNPIFNLTPAATVDEGNNWINISWGPLAHDQPGDRRHARQLRAGGGFAGHQLHPVHCARPMRRRRAWTSSAIRGRLTTRLTPARSSSQARVLLRRRWPRSPPTPASAARSLT